MKSKNVSKRAHEELLWEQNSNQNSTPQAQEYVDDGVILYTGPGASTKYDVWRNGCRPEDSNI